MLLSVAMLFTTISVVASAQEHLGIAIIYTNDVHCAIDDYPVIAAYEAKLIKEGCEVIIVDAGDAIQGEVVGSLRVATALSMMLYLLKERIQTAPNMAILTDFTVQSVMSLFRVTRNYRLTKSIISTMIGTESATFAVRKIFGKKIYVSISATATIGL